MKWRAVRWPGALLAVLLLVAPSAGAADDAAENRRALQQLQDQIRQAAKRLEGQGATERNLLAELQEVDEAQRQLDRRIEGLNRRLQGLDRDLLQLGRESQAAATRIARLEEQVRQRLGLLYRQGNITPLRFLIGGEAPVRLAQDAFFMERVLRRDRELLQEYRRELAQRQETLTRLATLRHDEAQLLQQREGDVAVLAEAAALKGTLLARVRQERTQLAAQLAELQQRAVELAALIRRLEAARDTGPAPARLALSEQKGRLPWPAAGRVRIGFGTSRHPELGTLYQSQGVELLTDAGQAVTAVWPGKVVFANQFKGYGELMILEHGGGFFTLYAQLAQPARRVGDVVAQGDLLARPGGKDHDRLYFEIRKGGIPLDPREWLVPR